MNNLDGMNMSYYYNMCHFRILRQCVNVLHHYVPWYMITWDQKYVASGKLDPNLPL